MSVSPESKTQYVVDSRPFEYFHVLVLYIGRFRRDRPVFWVVLCVERATLIVHSTRLKSRQQIEEIVFFLLRRDIATFVQHVFRLILLLGVRC